MEPRKKIILRSVSDLLLWNLGFGHTMMWVTFMKVGSRLSPYISEGQENEEVSFF